MIRRTLQVAALAASCALLLVCNPAGTRQSTVPANCQSAQPLIVPQQTDILFVIDNSGSMREEQAGVAQELPAFVAALQQGAGVENDFQVGVITTSVYQNSISPPPVGQVLRLFPDQEGRLRPATLPGGGTTRILSGTDPNLVPVFATLVQQGTSGSGQETPFEAVRLATSSPLVDTDNAGFLRKGSRLVVVVVSDEDDCSEQVTFTPGGGLVAPPQVAVSSSTNEDFCTKQSDKLGTIDQYYDVYNSLSDGSGGKRDVLWAAIAPVARTDKTALPIDDNGTPRNIDCPTSNGPGLRHRAMALKFNQQLANLDSICNTSYRDTLINIAALANITSSIAVHGMPDPRLVTVEITRADDSVQKCTIDNGGIRYEDATEIADGRIYFLGPCPRLPDDKHVELRMLCAG
ncbi:MAG TPA: vWA domain-containing protein [Myxococcaceae bacterium]|nr:vWA domain-containing protein [Myxococcaceae bacterium]